MPQSIVLFTQGSGIPGELAYDGPQRAYPWTISGNGTEPNIVGATAYTEVSEGNAAVGGTSTFVGILVNPKSYAAYGTSNAPGGPIAPTMTLPDNTIGELATMGTYFLALNNTSAAPAIGDKLIFNNTTGGISSLPQTTSVPTGSTLITGAIVVLKAGALISGTSYIAIVELNG